MARKASISSPDLDAGATGTMPSAMIPDVLGEVVRRHRRGDRDAARALYEQWLPLILYENRLCGLRATKVLMHVGGIIESEATRSPLPPLSAQIRAGLIELAHRLDPLILRWARSRSRPDASPVLDRPVATVELLWMPMTGDDRLEA